MDGKALGSFRVGVEYIRRTLHPEFPVQQFAILVEVATEPGITMPELSKRLKMSSASISKNIRSLSRFKEEKEIKGYDLVFTTPSLDDRRRFSVYLTRTGEKWVEDFFKSVYTSREKFLPYINQEVERLGLSRGDNASRKKKK